MSHKFGLSVESSKQHEAIIDALRNFRPTPKFSLAEEKRRIFFESYMTKLYHDLDCMCCRCMAEFEEYVVRKENT